LVEKYFLKQNFQAKRVSYSIYEDNYTTAIELLFWNRIVKPFGVWKVTDSTSTTTIAQPQEVAVKIKEIARRIREQSALMRNTIRTIHKSGAIEELTVAVRDAVITARDVSQEIQGTAKELRDRGVIKDIADTIEETSDIIKTESAKAKKKTEEEIFPSADPQQEVKKDQNLAPKATPISTTTDITSGKDSKNKARQEAEQREQLLNQAQRKLRKKRGEKKT
jgi:hypothetical protein